MGKMGVNRVFHETWVFVPGNSMGRIFIFIVLDFGSYKNKNPGKNSNSENEIILYVSHVPPCTTGTF